MLSDWLRSESYAMEDFGIKKSGGALLARRKAATGSPLIVFPDGIGVTMPNQIRDAGAQSIRLFFWFLP